MVSLLNCWPSLWLDTPLQKKQKTALNQRASKTQDMQKHLCPYCCLRQYRNSDLHRVLGWRLMKESYVTVGCSEDEPDLKQQCLAHNVSARMLRSRGKNWPPTESSSTTTSVYAKANGKINGTNMFIWGILLAACWTTSIKHSGQEWQTNTSRPILHCHVPDFKYARFLWQENTLKCNKE